MSYFGLGSNSASREKKHDPCPGKKGVKVPFFSTCFNPGRFDPTQFGQDFRDTVMAEAEIVGNTAGGAVGAAVGSAAEPIENAIKNNLVVTGLIGAGGIAALEIFGITDVI